MKRLLAATVAIALLAGTAYAGGGKPWSRTGDKELDSTLEQIDIQAKSYPDAFIRDLSVRHNIPEQEIRQMRETYGLGAGDIFMATSLAGATHRSCSSLAEEYKKSPGKGWGVMAMGMGIKPGSTEFKAMKSGAHGSLDHMQSMAKDSQKHDKEMMKQHDQMMKKNAQSKGHGKPN